MALSHIFSLTPLWKPQPSNNDDKSDVQMDGPAPGYPEFSVEDLVAQGKLLLASSGKEFLKPSGILSSAAEVSKARKEAMSRLGLEFLDDVADDLNLEKELADEDGDVPMDSAGPSIKSDNNTPAGSSPMDVSAPSPPASRSGSVTPAVDNDEPEGDPNAMSAREKNRLKRKRKQGTAFVHAPPTQATGSKYTAAPGATGTK